MVLLMQGTLVATYSLTETDKAALFLEKKKSVVNVDNIM